jgi:Fe-S cluster biosynthesis and repair protein YggX
MGDVACTRCGQTREGIPYRPFPNELGRRLVERICQACWGDWLRLQQQLINHYGLNLREQSAKDFLYAQLEQHLFTSAPRS